MSKLRCQIHRWIIDFWKKMPPFGFSALRLHISTAVFCDVILRQHFGKFAIFWQFLKSRQNVQFFWQFWQSRQNVRILRGTSWLPPPSSRAISFTISISAAAAKTGNKSKVIKAVAQRQKEGEGGDKTIKLRNKDRQSLHLDLWVGDNHRKNKEN